MDNIRKDIIAIAENILEQKDIDADENFGKMNLDSLSFVEIMFSIEEKYSITIEDDDVGKIDNLSSLITLIENRVNDDQVQ